MRKAALRRATSGLLVINMKGILFAIAAAAIAQAAPAFDKRWDNVGAASASGGIPAPTYSGRYPDSGPSTYNATGNLTQPEPKPYTPAGGINTNGSHIPVYHPASDFDYESLNLVLHQEYIELDLFEYGLKRFSAQDFEQAGLNQADRDLIAFMAQQEVGHAKMVTDILGPTAPKRCQYKYPFNTVHEFNDFCQKLTRWGESGVYGFLEHLDSRDSAQLLLQSITTEARQQMIFRQFDGLHPMPVWFEDGITQSMAWTLLAPYIVSCPADNPRLQWQNFPALNVTNNPNPAADNQYKPAISTNRPALFRPGEVINLSWENPGMKVGPNMSYTTSTNAGAPKFAGIISQLNLTYVPLENIKSNSAQFVFPNSFVYPSTDIAPGVLDPVVNETAFVFVTDDDPFLTPANLSLINSHIAAGPALLQAG
ncbi:hypothetical protein BZG36_05683 [Bifiguratus adelaidae]|uniref:Protein rds1 n=1 Tax=Bifiguratus adelaidae TaxID=1938954 RepID=A0A261XSN5_9FUNG|nr:hypothetical protein BZG36_05683 [Bifiguratus adelaidae]